MTGRTRGRPRGRPKGSGRGRGRGRASQTDGSFPRRSSRSPPPTAVSSRTNAEGALHLTSGPHGFPLSPHPGAPPGTYPYSLPNSVHAPGLPHPLSQLGPQGSTMPRGSSSKSSRHDDQAAGKISSGTQASWQAMQQSGLSSGRHSSGSASRQTSGSKQDYNRQCLDHAFSDHRHVTDHQERPTARKAHRQPRDFPYQQEFELSYGGQKEKRLSAVNQRHEKEPSYSSQRQSSEKAYKEASHRMQLQNMEVTYQKQKRDPDYFDQRQDRDTVYISRRPEKDQVYDSARSDRERYVSSKHDREQFPVTSRRDRDSSFGAQRQSSARRSSSTESNHSGGSQYTDRDSSPHCSPSPSMGYHSQGMQPYMFEPRTHSADKDCTFSKHCDNSGERYPPPMAVQFTGSSRQPVDGFVESGSRDTVRDSVYGSTMYGADSHMQSKNSCSGKSGKANRSNPSFVAMNSGSSIPSQRGLPYPDQTGPRCVPGPEQRVENRTTIDPCVKKLSDQGNHVRNSSDRSFNGQSDRERSSSRKKHSSSMRDQTIDLQTSLPSPHPGSYLPPSPYYASGCAPSVGGDVPPAYSDQRNRSKVSSEEDYPSFRLPRQQFQPQPPENRPPRPRRPSTPSSPPPSPYPSRPPTPPLYSPRPSSPQPSFPSRHVSPRYQQCAQDEDCAPTRRSSRVMDNSNRVCSGLVEAYGQSYNPPTPQRGRRKKSEVVDSPEPVQPPPAAEPMAWQQQYLKHLQQQQQLQEEQVQQPDEVQPEHSKRQEQFQREQMQRDCGKGTEQVQREFSRREQMRKQQEQMQREIIKIQMDKLYREHVRQQEQLQMQHMKQLEQMRREHMKQQQDQMHREHLKQQDPIQREHFRQQQDRLQREQMKQMEKMRREHMKQQEHMQREHERLQQEHMQREQERLQREHMQREHECLHQEHMQREQERLQEHMQREHDRFQQESMQRERLMLQESVRRDQQEQTVRGPIHPQERQQPVLSEDGETVQRNQHQLPEYVPQRYRKIQQEPEQQQKQQHDPQYRQQHEQYKTLRQPQQVGGQNGYQHPHQHYSQQQLQAESSPHQHQRHQQNQPCHNQQYQQQHGHVNSCQQQQLQQQIVHYQQLQDNSPTHQRQRDHFPLVPPWRQTSADRETSGQGSRQKEVSPPQTRHQSRQNASPVRSSSQDSQTPSPERRIHQSPIRQTHQSPVRQVSLPYAGGQPLIPTTTVSYSVVGTEQTMQPSTAQLASVTQTHVPVPTPYTAQPVFCQNGQVLPQGSQQFETHGLPQVRMADKPGPKPKKPPWLQDHENQILGQQKTPPWQQQAEQVILLPGPESVVGSASQHFGSVTSSAGPQCNVHQQTTNISASSAEQLVTVNLQQEQLSLQHQPCVNSTAGVSHQQTLGPQEGQQYIQYQIHSTSQASYQSHYHGIYASSGTLQSHSQSSVHSQSILSSASASSTGYHFTQSSSDPQRMSHYSTVSNRDTSTEVHVVPNHGRTNNLTRVQTYLPHGRERQTEVKCQYQTADGFLAATEYQSIPAESSTDQECAQQVLVEALNEQIQQTKLQNPEKSEVTFSVKATVLDQAGVGVQTPDPHPVVCSAGVQTHPPEAIPTVQTYTLHHLFDDSNRLQSQTQTPQILPQITAAGPINLSQQGVLQQPVMEPSHQVVPGNPLDTAVAMLSIPDSVLDFPSIEQHQVFVLEPPGRQQPPGLTTASATTLRRNSWHTPENSTGGSGSGSFADDDVSLFNDLTVDLGEDDDNIFLPQQPVPQSTADSKVLLQNSMNIPNLAVNDLGLRISSVFSLATSRRRKRRAMSDSVLEEVDVMARQQGLTEDGLGENPIICKGSNNQHNLSQGVLPVQTTVPQGTSEFQFAVPKDQKSTSLENGLSRVNNVSPDPLAQLTKLLFSDMAEPSPATTAVEDWNLNEAAGVSFEADSVCVPGTPARGEPERLATPLPQLFTPMPQIGTPMPQYYKDPGTPFTRYQTIKTPASPLPACAKEVKESPTSLPAKSCSNISVQDLKEPQTPWPFPVKEFKEPDTPLSSCAMKPATPLPNMPMKNKDPSFPPPQCAKGSNPPSDPQEQKSEVSDQSRVSSSAEPQRGDGVFEIRVDDFQRTISENVKRASKQPLEQAIRELLGDEPIENVTETSFKKLTTTSQTTENSEKVSKQSQKKSAKPTKETSQTANVPKQNRGSTDDGKDVRDRVKDNWERICVSQSSNTQNSSISRSRESSRESDRERRCIQPIPEPAPGRNCPRSKAQSNPKNAGDEEADKKSCGVRGRRTMTMAGKRRQASGRLSSTEDLSPQRPDHRPQRNGTNNSDRRSQRNGANNPDERIQRNVTNTRDQRTRHGTNSPNHRSQRHVTDSPDHRTQRNGANTQDQRTHRNDTNGPDQRTRHSGKSPDQRTRHTTNSPDQRTRHATNSPDQRTRHATNSPDQRTRHATNSPEQRTQRHTTNNPEQRTQRQSAHSRDQRSRHSTNSPDRRTQRHSTSSPAADRPWLRSIRKLSQDSSDSDRSKTPSAHTPPQSADKEQPADDLNQDSFFPSLSRSNSTDSSVADDAEGRERKSERRLSSSSSGSSRPVSRDRCGEDVGETLVDLILPTILPPLKRQRRSDRTVSNLPDLLATFHEHKLRCVELEGEHYVVLEEVLAKCFPGLSRAEVERARVRDLNLLTRTVHLLGSDLSSDRGDAVSVLTLSDAARLLHFFHSMTQCPGTDCKLKTLPGNPRDRKDSEDPDAGSANKEPHDSQKPETSVNRSESLGFVYPSSNTQDDKRSNGSGRRKTDSTKDEEEGQADSDVHEDSHSCTSDQTFPYCDGQPMVSWEMDSLTKIDNTEGERMITHMTSPHSVSSKIRRHSSDSESRMHRKRDKDNFNRSYLPQSPDVFRPGEASPMLPPLPSYTSPFTPGSVYNVPMDNERVLLECFSAPGSQAPSSVRSAPSVRLLSPDRVDLPHLEDDLFAGLSSRKSVSDFDTVKMNTEQPSKHSISSRPSVDDSEVEDIEDRRFTDGKITAVETSGVLSSGYHYQDFTDDFDAEEADDVFFDDDTQHKGSYLQSITNVFESKQAFISSQRVALERTQIEISSNAKHIDDTSDLLCREVEPYHRNEICVNYALETDVCLSLPLSEKNDLGKRVSPVQGRTKPRKQTEKNAQLADELSEKLSKIAAEDESKRVSECGVKDNTAEKEGITPNFTQDEVRKDSDTCDHPSEQSCARCSVKDNVSDEKHKKPHPSFQEDRLSVALSVVATERSGSEATIAYGASDEDNEGNSSNERLTENRLSSQSSTGPPHLSTAKGSVPTNSSLHTSPPRIEPVNAENIPRLTTVDEADAESSEDETVDDRRPPDVSDGSVEDRVQDFITHGSHFTPRVVVRSNSLPDLFGVEVLTSPMRDCEENNLHLPGAITARSNSYPGTSDTRKPSSNVQSPVPSPTSALEAASVDLSKEASCPADQSPNTVHESPEQDNETNDQKEPEPFDSEESVFLEPADVVDGGEIATKDTPRRSPEGGGDQLFQWAVPCALHGSVFCACEGIDIQTAQEVAASPKVGPWLCTPGTPVPGTPFCDYSKLIYSPFPVVGGMTPARPDMMDTPAPSPRPPPIPEQDTYSCGMKRFAPPDGQPAPKRRSVAPVKEGADTMSDETADVICDNEKTHEAVRCGCDGMVRREDDDCLPHERCEEKDKLLPRSEELELIAAAEESEKCMASLSSEEKLKLLSVPSDSTERHPSPGESDDDVFTTSREYYDDNAAVFMLAAIDQSETPSDLSRTADPKDTDGNSDKVIETTNETSMQNDSTAEQSTTSCEEYCCLKCEISGKATSVTTSANVSESLMDQILHCTDKDTNGLPSDSSAHCTYKNTVDSSLDPVPNCTDEDEPQSSLELVPNDTDKDTFNSSLASPAHCEDPCDSLDVSVTCGTDKETCDSSDLPVANFIDKGTCDFSFASEAHDTDKNMCDSPPTSEPHCADKDTPGSPLDSPSHSTDMDIADSSLVPEAKCADKDISDSSPLPVTENADKDISDSSPLPVTENAHKDISDLSPLPVTQSTDKDMGDLPLLPVTHCTNKDAYDSVFDLQSNSANEDLSLDPFSHSTNKDLSLDPSLHSTDEDIGDSPFVSVAQNTDENISDSFDSTSHRPDEDIGDSSFVPEAHSMDNDISDSSLGAVTQSADKDTDDSSLDSPSHNTDKDMQDSSLDSPSHNTDNDTHDSSLVPLADITDKDTGDLSHVPEALCTDKETSDSSQSQAANCTASVEMHTGTNMPEPPLDSRINCTGTNVSEYSMDPKEDCEYSNIHETSFDPNVDCVLANTPKSSFDPKEHSVCSNRPKSSVENATDETELSAETFADISKEAQPQNIQAAIEDTVKNEIESMSSTPSSVENKLLTDLQTVIDNSDTNSVGTNDSESVNDMRIITLGDSDMDLASLESEDSRDSTEVKFPPTGRESTKKEAPAEGKKTLTLEQYKERRKKLNEQKETSKAAAMCRTSEINARTPASSPATPDRDTKSPLPESAEVPALDKLTKDSTVRSPKPYDTSRDCALSTRYGFSAPAPKVQRTESVPAELSRKVTVELKRSSSFHGEHPASKRFKQERGDRQKLWRDDVDSRPGKHASSATTPHLSPGSTSHKDKKSPSYSKSASEKSHNVGRQTQSGNEKHRDITGKDKKKEKAERKEMKKAKEKLKEEKERGGLDTSKEMCDVSEQTKTSERTEQTMDVELRSESVKQSGVGITQDPPGSPSTVTMNTIQQDSVISTANNLPADSPRKEQYPSSLRQFSQEHSVQEETMPTPVLNESVPVPDQAEPHQSRISTPTQDERMSTGSLGEPNSRSSTPTQDERMPVDLENPALEKDGEVVKSAGDSSDSDSAQQLDPYLSGSSARTRCDYVCRPKPRPLPAFALKASSTPKKDLPHSAAASKTHHSQTAKPQKDFSRKVSVPVKPGSQSGKPRTVLPQKASSQAGSSSHSGVADDRRATVRSREEGGGAGMEEQLSERLAALLQEKERMRAEYEQRALLLEQTEQGLLLELQKRKKKTNTPDTAKD